MLVLVMGILAVIIGFTIKSINLKPIEVKKEWILWLFLIIQTGYRFIKNLTTIQLISIECVLIILLLVFLLYNKKQTSIIFTAWGFVLNYIAMIFNYGKMPVKFAYGVSDVRHIITSDNTQLYFLSDILSLPYPLNICMVRFSIGDVIIWVGWMIIIIQLIYFNVRKVKNNK